MLTSSLALDANARIAKLARRHFTAGNHARCEDREQDRSRVRLGKVFR